jgi:putative ABC transport system permease protein
MTASVALNADRHREPARSVAFFRQFLEELHRTPGVVAAASPVAAAFVTTRHACSGVSAVTRPEDAPVTWFRRVSAGYFRAMEIPLLRGRLFDAAEERNPGTVVVNQEMAARYWPGEDPIGRHIRGAARDPRAAGPWLTVIGVVGNIHHMALDAASEPEMYLPYVATPVRTAAVSVRTTLDPQSLAPVLAGAARAIDREQAVSAADARVRSTTRLRPSGSAAPGVSRRSRFCSQWSACAASPRTGRSAHPRDGVCMALAPARTS